MIRVYNRHNAQVAGVPARGYGHVPEEALERYAYALRREDAPENEPAEDDDNEPAEGRMKASEALRLIRSSDDPEAVEAFLSDPRSSVRNAARHRLTVITSA